MLSRPRLVCQEPGLRPIIVPEKSSFSTKIHPQSYYLYKKKMRIQSKTSLTDVLIRSHGTGKTANIAERFWQYVLPQTGITYQSNVFYLNSESHELRQRTVQNTVFTNS